MPVLQLRLTARCPPATSASRWITARMARASLWFFSKIIEQMDTVFFNGMLNYFVHIFLHLYYGLTSLGRKVESHISWKRRYLPILQLLYVHPSPLLLQPVQRMHISR